MSGRFLYYLFDEHTGLAGAEQGAGWRGRLPHRQPQDSTACQVSSFTACLMNMPPVLGQNRELADEAGFLTVNPKTLQHVKWVPLQPVWWTPCLCWGKTGSWLTSRASSPSTPRLYSVSSRFLYYLFDEHAARAGAEQGAGWRGGLPHRLSQDSTACPVGSFTTCSKNTLPVLGQNRELADEAGFLTVNPKTLQHVK